MRTKKTCGTCKWWCPDPDRYGTFYGKCHLGMCLLALREDAPLFVYADSEDCSQLSLGLSTYDDFSCKAWTAKP